MDVLSDAFMLLSHELESNNTGLLLSPFDVVRYANRSDEAYEQIVRTLEGFLQAQDIRISARDFYDDFVSKVLGSNDDFPKDALYLWQPLLVLVHEAFGCYEVVRDIERFKEDSSYEGKISEELLKDLKIYPKIAKRIPCTQVTYALEFAKERNGSIDSDLIGLVLVNTVCHRRQDLRKKIGAPLDDIW